MQGEESAVKVQDMMVQSVAMAGADGMLNLHFCDKSDPNVRASIVYDRESGELFDAYVREQGLRELSDSETIQLLASAVCQLAATTAR